MRRVIILYSILSSLTLIANGQTQDSIEDEELVSYSDPLPTYPGGFDSLMTFIKKNLKYPEGSLDYIGKVYVGFVITEDGSPVDFKILKRLCDLCDKNAIETLKKMPKWTPAMVDGKPTRTKMVFPIKYGR